MILNNSPQDKAVLSNVGQIGEFRIRNSAKAFSILSSGLYANKIRAIIRELSCNAYDSHVAAGKVTTPYDVHLPSPLEPWFSIRDYGTGLNHEQVTNLYTTYFESTKTESNDFVGALGLGSKSPFSYTDNFTVTAVKDGVRGVYTAFINEQGVPSIALMTQSDTTEPNGVEVKFAVANKSDYSKFVTEAAYVYKHFKLQPVVSGVAQFTPEKPVYQETNLVPGIHRVKCDQSRYSSGTRSVAIMGNIEYPIDVPESEQKNLGTLASLLTCGLVIEFNIGDLDFQASREGLSYVGVTLQSIKTRLTELRDSLLVKVEVEANALENLWERAIYIEKNLKDNLYKAAAAEYLVKHNFDLVKNDPYQPLKSWNLVEKDLAEKYNIKLRAGSRTRHEQKVSVESSVKDYHVQDGDYYRIAINPDLYFVINDTRRGAFERAKYHWRKKSLTVYNETFYVIEPVDKDKPVKTKEFFAAISNPPENKILKASSLDEKPKAVREKAASILELERRATGRHGRYSTFVWAPAGSLDDFDDNETYYYVPLHKFQPSTISTEKDVKVLCEILRDSGIFTGTLYGVKAKDLDQVKANKNWVHLDVLVMDKLKAMTAVSAKSLVKSAIDIGSHFVEDVAMKVNDGSPFKTLYMDFKDVEAYSNNYNVDRARKFYNVKKEDTEAVTNEKNQWLAKVKDVRNRYPLLSKLSYSVDNYQVIEYINMVDQVKGI